MCLAMVRAASLRVSLVDDVIMRCSKYVKTSRLVRLREAESAVTQSNWKNDGIPGVKISDVFMVIQDSGADINNVASAKF